MMQKISKLEREKILRQRREDSAAQQVIFEKNKEKIFEKYAGKIIAYVDSKLYAADSRSELWTKIGNPGEGGGFIADLRQIDSKTGKVIYPPQL